MKTFEIWNLLSLSFIFSSLIGKNLPTVNFSIYFNICPWVFITLTLYADYLPDFWENLFIFYVRPLVFTTTKLSWKYKAALHENSQWQQKLSCILKGALIFWPFKKVALSSLVFIHSLSYIGDISTYHQYVMF